MRHNTCIISFEVYDGFIGQKILKLMKAGKLAISLLRRQQYTDRTSRYREISWEKGKGSVNQGYFFPKNVSQYFKDTSYLKTEKLHFNLENSSNQFLQK